MPDIYTKYEYNDKGDLIDPPRIPDMERQLIEAGANGDDALIEILTEEYDGKRHDMAERHNKRVDDRANEDRRLLAERDERARAESQRAADDRAEQVRRDELDTLRANPGPEPDWQTPGNPAPSPTGPEPTGESPVVPGDWQTPGNPAPSPTPTIAETPAAAGTAPGTQGGENR